MQLIYFLVPCLLCLVEGFSSRRSAYRRTVAEPFTAQDAIPSSRKIDDSQQSPSLSILSHMARPYMLRPRRRISTSSLLPLQQESRMPERPSYSASSQSFRNRELRPSKPRFDFGSDSVGETEFYPIGEETIRSPARFTPENSRRRPVYSTTEDPYYSDYKDEREPVLYLEDEPIYLVEEEKQQERPRRNQFQNRPLVPAVSDNYYRTLERDEPRAHVNQYPKAPTRDYPRAAVSDYPKRPTRNYPKAPVSDYPKRPTRNYPKAPVSDYPKQPFREYHEAPVVSGYPNRPIKEYSAVPKRPTSDYTRAPVRIPERSIPKPQREAEFSEPQRTRIRKRPQTSFRPKPSYENHSPEALEPVYQTKPFPQYNEQIPKRTSSKYRPEVDTPRPTSTKKEFPKRLPSFPKIHSEEISSKRILRKKKKPTVSRFASTLKKEKRQTHGGHHLDKNGLDFMDQTSKIQKHSGDGRIAFQIHGQKGPHSYKFGYDTGKGKNRQFRYEERDNYGEVKGRYGYYDLKGKLNVVNYAAHPKHGFVADIPDKH